MVLPANNELNIISPGAEETAMVLFVRSLLPGSSLSAQTEDTLCNRNPPLCGLYCLVFRVVYGAQDTIFNRRKLQVFHGSLAPPALAVLKRVEEWAIQKQIEK